MPLFTLCRARTMIRVFLLSKKKVLCTVLNFLFVGSDGAVK